MIQTFENPPKTYLFAGKNTLTIHIDYHPSRYIITRLCYFLEKQKLTL